MHIHSQCGCRRFATGERECEWQNFCRILDIDAHKQGSLLRYTFIKMLTKSVYLNNLCHGISTLCELFMFGCVRVLVHVFFSSGAKNEHHCVSIGETKFLSHHIRFSNLWIMVACRCVCLPADQINTALSTTDRDR